MSNRFSVSVWGAKMTQERAPASLSATSTGAVNCTEFNWAVASWCLITLPVVKSRRRT